ncbi:sulfatase-like hydrolase/transferase [Natrinema halophilum]|uniref:Sulfatase-like hydrolase/transferase n=1 Tax=Natrinema halophilum TaxID=1699371 RepID=A0A7D5GFV4_9EURY|nr:sulfatase-like hydrolase/transferase [Natrinema halophilum]QLG47847.1 sulfatase-like hydrolase/transferase [Natrinema halophilum]
MDIKLGKDTSVLFITVDAARADVMGNNSGSPSPTPFINNLFENNFTLDSCFSTGYPTQFALPGLITSTLPLDYGGYDKGIYTRPSSISEPFEQHGMDTIAFVNGFAPNSLFGYDRGFQRFHHFNSLASILGSFMNIYTKYYAEREFSSSKSSGFSSYKEFVKRFFPFLRKWCEKRKRETDEGDGKLPFLSPRLHDINWERAISVIEAAIEEYEEKQDQFVRDLIKDYPEIDAIESLRDAENWNGIDLAFSRIRRLEFQALKMIGGTNPYFVSVAKNEGLKPSLKEIKSWAEAPLISPGSSSCGYIFANLFNYIQDTENSFFAWTHLIDAHSNNYFSWEISDSSCPFPHMSNTLERELLSHLRYMRSMRPWQLNGSPKYDLGLRTIDLNLENFLNRVYESMDNPPLVVITADHGHEVLPSRSGHHATHFYDELLHIPVAFVHPSMPSESFEGLCSSMDIAPTLFDILGFNIPSGFQGTPVSQLSKKGREYIIAEDYGRGPIDPVKKSPNVCIRSAERKIVYSPTESSDLDTEIKSAYNLDSDPMELESIDIDDINKRFDILVDRARTRCKEIEESIATRHEL